MQIAPPKIQLYCMKVRQLIKKLEPLGNNSISCDFEVRGISCNSKTVEDGFVFVAVKGSRQDGNKFIDEAIQRGAKAIVAQGFRNGKLKNICNVALIKVKDARQALARLATEFYSNPSSKIKVVGITGTNGKTTITYLIEAILKEARSKPAVIGTINYRFNGKEIPSKNTTPGPIELQAMLADMAKEDIDYAIMEVSSHALDQDRTEGINFSSAIFTNLTQDHLDYHKTLGNYFKAKARLFRGMDRGAFAVINNDDKYARQLKKLTRAKIITYGIENDSDVTAKNIKSCVNHTEFLLKAPGIEADLSVNLIGRHNLYNILSAVAWAIEDGLDFNVIKRAVEEFSLVPGRLEKVELGQSFSVFVDYAHTEDALKNIISALRNLTGKRIIVVFGCGGDRDKTKRPKMGRVVTELADFAIITSDNPRSEDPLKIIAEIKKGIRRSNYSVMPDRHEAIKESLSLAKAGDIVLLAGKGHETYQVLKDMTVHFDDREVVKECLKSVNY